MERCNAELRCTFCHRLIEAIFFAPLGGKAIHEGSAVADHLEASPRCAIGGYVMRCAPIDVRHYARVSAITGER
jgi:hypothetical protein